MEKIFNYLETGVRKGHNVYIAQNATVIGDVQIDDDASIWFGVVIRGDVEKIRIGKRSNIQDCSCIHVSNGTFSVDIGENVTIGHSVNLHGCKIEDNVLVGIGAIILDGAIIHSNTVIAAGALVPPGKEIPSNSMVMGSPAKITRQLTCDEILWIRRNADHYAEYKDIYMEFERVKNRRL